MLFISIFILEFMSFIYKVENIYNENYRMFIDWMKSVYDYMVINRFLFNDLKLSS